MKYWFYSEGNILGPYAPAELLSLPAFGQGSLVCPETSTGDNPGDWKAAEAVAEIASALSVGVGGVISSQTGGVSGLYELETGLSSGVGASYYEARNDQPYGYENLLNTLDNILGTGNGAEVSPDVKPAPDYELMDRFDIRLSKIQEELEAARWEKNLLMEKIRAKDAEERKNRERIVELEGKLKGAMDRTELQEKELSQVQHLSELTAKAETLKKIDELRKEDYIDRSGAPVTPVARPAGESRILKSLQPSQDISLERSFAAGQASPQSGAASGYDSANKKEERDNSALTSRKLKSLGRSPAPVVPVSGEEHKGSAPGSESYSAPDYAASQPLPQQASGVVYDFTVVTGQTAENEKIQFKIEPKNEPAPQSQQPAPQPVFQQPAPQVQSQNAWQSQPTPAQPAPQVQPQNAWQPQPAPAQSVPPAQPQYSWQPQPTPAQPAPQVQPQNAWQPQPAPAQSAPLAQPQYAWQPAASPAPARNEYAVPDKTERLPVSPEKQKEEVKKNVQPPKKGRGKMAFISTLIIFGAMAAGGLGYLFLGEGVSFSEIFMLNFGGSGKSKKASFSTQIEPKADKDTDETAVAEDTQAAVPEQADQAEAQLSAAVPVKPAFEAASNENTRKAIETVKNYKLSGGRSTVVSWFANSFLSNSASGSNEEWSATILHGDIFVVQYRLLRPKQDPLIYQFEVDVAKDLIVRGINNNAIELLDFSSKVTAKAEPAPKRKARKASPKTGKSRGIPILPLPDEPVVRQAQEDPTGFETAAAEGNEKVKYIVAQESDEELF